MKKTKEQAGQRKAKGDADTGQDEQKALLKACMRTLHHFFGGWDTLFGRVADGRNREWITYPLPVLLSTGVLMYLFRLGARRQINYQMRGNPLVREKFRYLFDVEEVPHGDTLQYAFERIAPEDLQEVVCGMVERLIRQKVLYPWRVYGNFLIAIDGTGMLTFQERHCEACLSRKQSNGKTLYYHPILEAKLVTANGFAFSLMTEFIENSDPRADKQDCELRAFYRLSARLKARFPRLPLCLLLDGLFACGPIFQICQDNGWRFLISLPDDALAQIHRSFQLITSQTPENQKHIRLGEHQEIHQDYRWAHEIQYRDSQDRLHSVQMMTCTESKPADHAATTTYKWLTNFFPTARNVDFLANGAARLRWKIENEGFNVQKQGGFQLEHPYSQHDTTQKIFYYVLQIAYTLFQLLQKGSLFQNAFPHGLGSFKNIATRLLEAWRNLRLSPQDFTSLYSGRFQIRFDTS
jgi:hypothetical protein